MHAVGTFLNTNVIVCAFDHSDPAKQARARSILANPPDRLTVSSQVLSEFYTVATKKLQPPPGAREALEAAGYLAQPATVVPLDASLVLNAMTLAQAHQLSLWDAQVIAAAQRAGCAVVLSDDLTDNQTLGGVTVRNPFA